MTQFLIVFASICGAISVALASWLSHGATDSFLNADLNALNTATDYLQLYSIVILVLVFAAQTVSASASLLRCACVFAFGMLLFSGGIYVSKLFALEAISFVIPIGGMSFIAGWLYLAVIGFRFFKKG